MLTTVQMHSILISRPLQVVCAGDQAAPIDRCEPMAWNSMFNVFLASDPNEEMIRKLAESFVLAASSG
jgi:hypothetical protein